MSYGDLISVSVETEVDFSNLERRLDDIDQKLDDVDVEDLERRVGELEDAGGQIGALAVLEERIEALERTRAQEATVIDLLRQLARALVG
jgi:hypothetical protein